MVLPLLVGIIAIPFAVKGLGKEGFGVLSIAWVILGYFGLFDFGFSRATTKFVSEKIGKNDLEAIPSITWTAVIISFCFGLLGMAILCMATPFLVEGLLKIPAGLVHQTKISFYILASSIPIILCSSCFMGVLEAAQRFDLEMMVMTPASIMLYIFSGLSLPFHLNLPTVVLLIVLSRVVAAFAYLFLCFKIFPNIKKKLVFSLTNLKAMASFGSWISVTNIISPLLVYLDRIFIGTFMSMVSVAFYTVPYEMVTRLKILPNAIMKTLFPEFSASSATSNTQQIEKLFVRAFEYILFLVGILAVLLFTYSSVILQAWMGAEFAQNSATVFRIFTIGIFVSSLAAIPFNLLQGIGRPDLPAKFHLVELPFYFALLYLLIHGFGIVGAAWAWLIRVMADAALLGGGAFKMFPRLFEQFKDKKNRTVRIAAYLLLLWGGLSGSHIFFGIIFTKVLAMASILAVFGLAVWRRILSDSEKGLALSIWLKLKKTFLHQQA